MQSILRPIIRKTFCLLWIAFKCIQITDKFWFRKKRKNFCILCIKPFDSHFISISMKFANILTKIYSIIQKNLLNRCFIKWLKVEKSLWEETLNYRKLLSYRLFYALLNIHMKLTRKSSASKDNCRSLQTWNYLPEHTKHL